MTRSNASSGGTSSPRPDRPSRQRTGDRYRLPGSVRTPARVLGPRTRGFWAPPEVTVAEFLAAGHTLTAASLTFPLLTLDADAPRAQRPGDGRLDPRPRARVRAARQDHDVAGDL